MYKIYEIIKYIYYLLFINTSNEGVNDLYQKMICANFFIMFLSMYPDVVDL